MLNKSGENTINSVEIADYWGPCLACGDDTTYSLHIEVDDIIEGETSLIQLAP